MESIDFASPWRRDSHTKRRSADGRVDRKDLSRVIHRSKKDLVYQILKDAVIDRRWHPGEKRSFEEISSMLQVSRTPVAEACKLLEKEGWVIIRPQVGVEVAPLSQEEILENLKIRGALEGLAGTEAIQHLREKDFEKLRQILTLMESTQKTNDFQKFIEWNQSFHHMIYQATKMRQLIKTLDQYWDHGKRYRGFYKHLPNVLAESNRRHRKILAALKAKNKEIVRTELEKDSWKFGEKLSRYFFNGKP